MSCRPLARERDRAGDAKSPPSVPGKCPATSGDRKLELAAGRAHALLAVHHAMRSCVELEVRVAARRCLRARIECATVGKRFPRGARAADVRRGLERGGRRVEPPSSVVPLRKVVDFWL